MKKMKKIFSVLVVLFLAILFVYYSDFKVVESGTILKRDTLTIEKSQVHNLFE